MQLKFEIVEKRSVRDQWLTWRGLIQEVIDKTEERCVPEDFFGEIMENRAFLFKITDETDHFFGITIVQLKEEKFTREPYMFVFAANLEAWNGETGPQMIAFYDSIAAKAGCKEIRFDTNRIGWTRKNSGCELMKVTFRRVIPNG